MLAVWAVSSLTLLLLAAVLPDFRLQSQSGDSFTRTALTAALGAGAFGLLSALVWPLLVRALLLVPALVLGLLVFFLNGSLLLLALGLIPEGRGQAAPETAVIVAAVMSATSSATSGFLAVRNDEAYRRRLVRLAGRRGRRAGAAPGPRTPGTLFLQLDGLGHDLLREATEGERPLMATVARWRATSHRLTPWRTDWSSQTGASQLGILHGSNEDLPAFRWYEKETGQLVVSNRPTSAAELQRRAVERTGDGGLLAYDGASRGNLFSGGADQVALVMSVAARRGRYNRSRAGYFAYFSDPGNATRTAVSFFAEIFREIAQSLRTRFCRELPRVKRGGLYPVIRAFATVVERDVVVAAVVGDMLAGRAAVYADLVAYDEVAHHSGPSHRDTHQVLRSLDRAVALIAKASRHAPRPYRIVLLSDHGQSPGVTFLDRYGLRLGDLVRAGCGLPVPRRAGRTRSGAEARQAARAALHRPEEMDGHSRSQPVVLASGNLGLVSFPDIPGRVTREELDRRNPALLGTLANHPGIGFLLVRSAEHGAVVLGPAGAEHHLDTGRVIGTDPLAAFGEGAADAVRRTDRFPHVADIMVNSAYDPATGEVHAFEEQIGSHGGLGGAQGHPFLLWPEELSPPVPDGGPLVGAEQVHRVLRRWLREEDGPQLPLTTGAGRFHGQSVLLSHASAAASRATDEANELRSETVKPEGFPSHDYPSQDKNR
ncbi:phage holin family protein [Streptomyces pinistramenti]|uniref:phage holin family protein n=1 Tax=Streptomyces pinistramenti TaxID=2884812 RepID=UPI001D095D3F|nr:phage holin family protein [Streptomyces pinistramenti]MCB5905942.1 phage holin family protein [Streptomyces pinistramenti]